MKRRFEKPPSYVELEISRAGGALHLFTRSGRIGREAATAKAERFRNPPALRAALKSKTAALVARGYREIPEGGFAGKLRRLLFVLAAKSPAAVAKRAAVLLDELEANAAYRNRLAEIHFDVRQHRAGFHMSLGEEAFRREEDRYWARADRSVLPNLTMVHYDYNYRAANRAMAKPGSAPKRGGTRPDYSAAVRELQRAFELAPAACDEAPVMLATIAIRNGDYAAAARWLARPAKADAGSARFVLAVVRCLQRKWSEADAIFRRMGGKSVRVLDNRAFIALQRGDPAKAADLFGQALRLDPKDGYARFHLQRLDRKG